MARRPTTEHDAERVAAWQAVDTLARSLDRALRQALADGDDVVALPWFRVLDHLHRHDGPCVVGDLSEATHAPISTVSGQLDHLEDAGFVRRRVGSDVDHRHIVVTLTPEGRRVWRLSDTVVRRVLRTSALARHAPADLATIVELCEVVGDE